ncbi:MAG: tetratricopeptide repeat protein, partial [Fibrobacter sp.]|nr:tetratricopeptide repeat protein [Fibrobacter sp.]
MKRIHNLIVLLLLTFSSLHAQKAVHSFIIARPVDMGAVEKTSKDIWAVSLIDELVRFRLEPLKEIKVVPVPILKSVIPDISDPTVPINQKQYSNAAAHFKTSYILTQKFELKNDKDFDYYLECISPDGNSIITSHETSFSLDNMASRLDSCLLGFLKQLNVTPTSQTTDFFRIPFLSKDARPIKQLGELLAEEKSNKAPDHDRLSKEYEKLIEKNPFLLLANYAAGLSFFYSKDYDKSAKYLKELLDLAPLHTHLYLVLIRSYRLGKRYNEALSISAQCDRMQLRTVPYLIEKALCYEGLDQISLALNVYNQILTLDSKQPQALYFLAKYKNDIAQYPEALTYVETLISVAPQNGYGYFEHGRNKFATGNYDQALVSLEKANSLLPNNAMVLEWLGDLYMRKQDYHKASDFYLKAFSGSVKTPKLLLKTAQAMELNKKPADALKLLKDNQIAFPDNLQIKKTIGQLELANGNLDAAYNVLSAYLATNPNDGDVMWYIGNIYSKKSQHNQAIEIYLKALPLLDENKTQCKLAIAEQYLKRKDFNNANKYLDEVIAEKPIKDANKLKGDAAMLAGDLRKAISYYDQERKVHGNNVTLQENIAKISFELNDLFYPAKNEYEKLAEMAPEHTEAQYYLAIINLKEGNVKKAENHLQKATGLGNGDAKIYFNLGLNYSQNKLDTKAAEYYEKCIKNKQNHIPALKNLSELYTRIGKDSAAAETYIKLFNADNTQSSALAKAGHIFKNLKIYNRATQTYDIFLNHKFTDFDVNVSYASIVYEKKDYNKVISLLKGVNGKWAEDELVLRILSDANCQTGNYKPALPLLKKLLLLNPENRNALKLAAIANEKTQDTVSAISMYERYLKLPPEKDHAENAFHLGLLYEKTKMFKKAISQYEANIAQYPDDIRNYEQLGGMYTLFEDWKPAERVLKAGTKLSSSKPVLTKMLAFTLYKQNNLAEAINYYTIYLNNSSTDAEAWKLLGKIYFSQENYKSSIQPLTKAVEYLPNDFNCLYMLGTSLVKTGEYSKAVAPLGRSRSLNNKNTDVIELLARCYRNLKETSTLTSLLKDWIAIDPKRYDIKMELGSLYLDENEITEAIQMLKEAVQFIPSQAKPYLLIAKAYEIQGNDSLQLEHLLKALRFAPDNWEIHYNLARYYLVKEKNEKAEEHLTTAIQQNPGNSTVHFEYGYYLLNKQKFTQSATEFNTALESEPNNSLYLAMYAYSLCMSG